MERCAPTAAHLGHGSWGGAGDPQETRESQQWLTSLWGHPLPSLDLDNPADPARKLGVGIKDTTPDWLSEKSPSEKTEGCTTCPCI